MTDEQIERATDAVEAERQKISTEFAKGTAENEKNKRGNNDRPYVSKARNAKARPCWRCLYRSAATAR